MVRRRILEADGQQALAAIDSGSTARNDVATAVRYLLEELATLAPGKTVEVRVPPYGAVQCVEGPAHTRGTPPNVIEMDAATWLGIARGDLSWDLTLAESRIVASGARANLDGLLPVMRRRGSAAT